MADVCAVFHWPPSAFDGMAIEELMGWRARAIDRAELFGLIKKAD